LCLLTFVAAILFQFRDLVKNDSNVALFVFVNTYRIHTYI
jgi:hypothetical protein